MEVDQRQVQQPRSRHAAKSVVPEPAADPGVGLRLSDDVGALAVRSITTRAELVHRLEDGPLDHTLTPVLRHGRHPRR